MRRRWRLNCCQRRYLIYGLTLIIPCLAVEFCAFWFSTLFWPSLPTNLPPNSAVILAIADPQLIGHRNEPKWIGGLSRWDSDRYLRRGFAHAIANYNPTLEVYLGDLFDEGVFFNSKQFEEERARFDGIFPVDEARTRIYLPGDNDIGGEMEPIYKDQLDNFEKQFPSRFVHNSDGLKHLTIFKTNLAKYGEFEGIYGQNKGENELSIRLLLSHVPIIPLMSAKLEQELHKISIILSAHDHTTAIYMQWRHPPALRRSTSASEIDNARWTVSLDNPAALPVIEFKVPTCSYRMGVSAMGYGLLVLTPFPANGTATAHFSVLWLPSRYAQLKFYAFMLIAVPLGWALYRWLWIRFRRPTMAREKGRKLLKSRKKRDEEKKRTWTAGDGTKYSRIGFDV